MWFVWHESGKFATTISKFTKEDTSTLDKFYLWIYTEDNISVILLSRHCNDNNDINDNNDVIKRVFFFDFYTFNFDIFLILLDAIQGLYYLALALWS